ncbi:hypothetical protein R0135_05445 [Congregibacter variabilis]|uniref:Uncharacterized protein n=1 Tax=Congregibacter variabilis TaxID=3081200 RepID=A0ABZ0I6C0_9GAMM|nr:hypothetical protein R0135_05445 [Congregibacter sp. IMCC43200]
MTDNDQQRFNLIFSGQLLPGTDIERAKRTLAAFFGLRDISGVAVFFSGKPVPLRRNITRTDAQRLYRQLRSVGLICELTPADPPKVATASTPPAQPSPAKPPGPKQSTKPRGQAPNLFALRPAFASQNPAQLRETSQIRSFIAAGAALALCVLVIAVMLRFPAAPAGREPLGPLAGTSLPDKQLVLLLEGALLIHERSGLPRARIGAGDLGFDRLYPPLWTMNNGDLLLNAAIAEGGLRLQRCNLEELRCYPFSPEVLGSPVTAIAGSLLGDSIFLLGEGGQLWRSNSAGEIEATATVQQPWGKARILSIDGLLLIPAGDGPMLGVYRPDQQNFGQQLDALLVMPAAAIAAGQDRLRDVSPGDESYWALMAGSDAAPGLFQLNQQWGNPRGIALPRELSTPYFISWRDKLLIADPKQAVIQRVASDGRLEAPFESSLILQERENWIKLAQQRSLMRQLGIGLPLILVLFCIATALLYLASYRALSAIPQERSVLLDPLPGGIHWLPGSAHRDRSVNQLGIALLLTSIFILALLGSLGGWQQALASLPLLIASLYAWSELRRGSGGHLGLLEKHFICVDYDGRYFYGKRSVLRGNAAILIASGLVLPVSIPVLPNLEVASLNKALYAPAHSSSRVEILGALWLSRHPWMNAALAITAGLLLTVSLLVIIG